MTYQDNGSEIDPSCKQPKMHREKCPVKSDEETDSNKKRHNMLIHYKNVLF